MKFNETAGTISQTKYMGALLFQWLFCIFLYFIFFEKLDSFSIALLMYCTLVGGKCGDLHCVHNIFWLFDYWASFPFLHCDWNETWLLVINWYMQVPSQVTKRLKK